MTLREDYDKALMRLQSHDRKYRSGIAAPVGDTVESVRAGLVHEFYKTMDRLVAAGEWEGPRIIKPRKKYRR